MKRLTAQWVRKAEEDYAGVQLAAGSDEPLYDLLCFHCQQVAEKYLKALLQESGVTSPRTHNLVKLIDLLLPTDPTLRSLLPIVLVNRLGPVRRDLNRE